MTLSMKESNKLETKFPKRTVINLNSIKLFCNETYFKGALSRA